MHDGGDLLHAACSHCSSHVERHGHGLLPIREQTVLRDLLRNASSYLEWGAGTSTQLALATPGVRHVHVIENQAGWCDVMERRSDIVCLSACLRRLGGAFELHCVRDGAQHAGYHFDTRLEQHAAGHSFRDPFRSAEVVLAREQAFHYVRLAADLRPSFDLILVDGRWRVACALQAWLLAHARTTVLFHDWDRAAEYHGTTLKHFELAGRVRALAVLRPRRSLMSELAQSQREAVWTDLMRALGSPARR